MTTVDLIQTAPAHATPMPQGAPVKVMIVTDAWEPQVNGVVRTLTSTRRELEAMGHIVDMITPLEFTTVPCPTYPEIRLSILPAKRVRRRIEAFAPQALHIATEGPLGLAARAYALRHKLPFDGVPRAFRSTCRRASPFRWHGRTASCTGSTAPHRR